MHDSAQHTESHQWSSGRAIQYLAPEVVTEGEVSAREMRRCSGAFPLLQRIAFQLPRQSFRSSRKRKETPVFLSHACLCFVLLTTRNIIGMNCTSGLTLQGSPVFCVRPVAHNTDVADP